MTHVMFTLVITLIQKWKPCTIHSRGTIQAHQGMIFHIPMLIAWEGILCVHHKRFSFHRFPLSHCPFLPSLSTSWCPPNPLTSHSPRGSMIFVDGRKKGWVGSANLGCLPPSLPSLPYSALYFCRSKDFDSRKN